MLHPPNPTGISAAFEDVDAVLLDAMGTLVRLRAPVPLLVEALAAAGYPNSPERVTAALQDEIAFYRAHHLRGRTPALAEVLRDDCARVLAGCLDKAPPRALLVELMVGALQLEVFPDVVPFLSYLRNRGVRTAVVSDWDCTLVEHLSRLGIRAWVDDVVVSADVGVTKPDPRIFDRALRVLDVAAGHAVHCGDDPRRDVLGAAASGIRPVLVDREHRYPEAPGRVSSLDELIGAI